jgi:hypothetical protein
MAPNPSKRGLAALLSLTICVPALALAVPRSAQVAVVGAPLQDGGAVFALVARAGGAVVRGGGTANVVVAESSEPGFVWRLYREGAWLVLDPLVAGGCDPTPTRGS